ncbi:MAG: MFS transporter [Eubacteriaceae bacterium]
MKNNKYSLIAVMSIFFIAMGIGTITPAIANIAAAFPDVPFTTILLASTLPSLLIIPSTLITGMIAGSKVKFKTLALLGLALFTISGVAPALFNSSFTLVLVFRAIFGISLGIISPLGNAILMGMFEGQARANMLGIGSLMMNIGGIVLQFLGGALSGISWQLCFWGHAPAILSFILVMLFLKEPEAPQVEGGGEVSSAKKEKVPMSVWVISAFFGVTMMLAYPMLVNMSSIMSEVKGVGNATQAALCLSMYTVGGAISGALFGKAYQILKRFILPVAFIGGAVGIAIIIYANSAVMMIVGTTITGLFYMLAMPAVMMLLGMYAPPSTMAMSISIMMAVMNVFAFLSTYWIGFIGSLTGDVYIMPVKFAMFGFLIAAGLLLVINPFPKVETAQ